MSAKRLKTDHVTDTAVTAVNIIRTSTLDPSEFVGLYWKIQKMETMKQLAILMSGS